MTEFDEDLQRLKADIGFLEGALSKPSDNGMEVQFMMGRIEQFVTGLRIKHALTLKAPPDTATA